MDNTEKNVEESQKERKVWISSTTLKVSVIVILSLLLLIPVSMIKDVINDRQWTAKSAEREVQEKYSGEQTLYAPTINIPIVRYEKNERDSGKVTVVREELGILPDSLRINGSITTETLRRSIYDVVVYSSHLEMEGTFTLPESIFEHAQNKTDLAYITIGLSDLRGIKDQLYLTLGDSIYKMSSGVGNCKLYGSGCNVPVKISANQRELKFHLAFNLNGSTNMSFIPLGETTEVNLTSNCETPSFMGMFLPEERNVTNEGFTAYWKVLNLNRNYPQMIVRDTDQEFYGHDVSDSAFGVNVIVPVQHYQKSMRCAKYALLIIVLTFVICFFTELLQKKSIHAFQYLLVGLALRLFYSLLVSLSEHIGFNAAYITASLMTAGMLTCYMGGVLKERKMAGIIGGLLLGLYAYIFVLVQLENYALLAGSIGLFLILACIMYMSQRIDWTNK